MRELTTKELTGVQGGCPITTAVVVAALGLATAGVYLLNTLFSSLLSNKSGSTPAQPSS